MSSTVRIASSPEERIAFQNILETPPETPIVEMNDETARDINVIWASIKAAANGWLGAQNSCFPKMPVDRKEFWGAFAKNYEHEPLPVLGKLLETLPQGEGRTAIDLGCGDSPAVPLLLQKGWRVLAVDNSRSVLDFLTANNKAAVDPGQLTIVQADVADLVIAANVLPYINPNGFRQTWEKIHHACVKKGGYFVGSLFRSAPSEKEVMYMNSLKAMGAWFLPDRRIVRPLLTEAGYKINTCKFHVVDVNRLPLCIQFVAEKK
jgi:SAM-dependent methyltransferase